MPIADEIEEVTSGLKMISLKSMLAEAEDVHVTYVNGEARLWAVDIVMAVTGKNRDDAGKVLRNLKPSVFDPTNFT
jgi:hypothetical protein